MLIKLRLQQGFTLTEILVVLAINLFVFTALVTLFIAILNHYNQNLNNNLLNEQLQAATDVMSNQIRRAGYWSNAASDIGTATNTNPFMQVASDLTISGGNCILFSYDRDANAALPAISTSYDDERYGFRLSGGAIQARPAGAAFDCNAAASAWENITDPATMTITNLNFTLTTQTIASGIHSLLIRYVDIAVTGELTSDATITKTITQRVRIRNDKYVP